ncbi:MAG: thioredoxin [Candidatus Amoebophilus sp. 36-38]|nr:MAG: thioredoxin [Candidatus Amoebophilus sp. 36-38]
MSAENRSLHLTDADFDQALKSSKPVLVDFWASWCGPCRMLGPIIEELAEDYQGRADIYKVNIDENSVAPNKYSIRSIPTMIIFKNGEPIERIVGVVSKIALEEKLDMYTA